MVQAIVSFIRVLFVSRLEFTYYDNQGNKHVSKHRPFRNLFRVVALLFLPGILNAAAANFTTSAPIPIQVGNSLLASTSTTNSYFGTSSSPSINANLLPMKHYSVQVLGVGATPSSWDVRIEGSVNNSTFTTILQHTQATGDGVLLYSGANIYPSLYIRSRVAAVSLGGATSIAVTILGTQ